MPQIYYNDTPLSQMPATYPASRVMMEDGDSVADRLNRGSVSVTADGVKTYSQLLDSLCALIDFSKIGRNTQLVTYGVGYFFVANFSSCIPANSIVEFTRNVIDSNKNRLDMYEINPSSSAYGRNVAGTYTDYSNNIVSNGTVLRLYY